jgi:hypothetical protein
MKIQHRPYHWVAVALVLAALLLTLSEVHGQSTGSSAVFEGRPAMAGAQGGLGAQAGPPQGGIGVQGTEVVERSTDGIKPARDRSLAKDQRSSANKVKRAAKRTATRSRHGVSEIDTGANKPATR